MSDYRAASRSSLLIKCLETTVPLSTENDITFALVAKLKLRKKRQIRDIFVVKRDDIFVREFELGMHTLATTTF